MRNLFFCALLTFVTTLFICSNAQAISNPQIYLHVNKGFTDKDEVSVNLLANLDLPNNGNDKVFIRMVLYSVENPYELFVKNNIFDFSQSIPDRMLTGLHVLQSWDESVVRHTNRVISFGKLKEGAYLAEAIYHNHVVCIPVFVTNYAILTRVVGNEALAFVTDKRTGLVLEDFKAYIGNYKNGLLEEATTYKRGIALLKLPDSFYFYNKMENLPVFITYGGNKMTAAKTAISSFNSQNIRQENSRGYVYTDRPVYRPVQWVYFQGIFREKVIRNFQVMKDSLQWILTDAKGQEAGKGYAKLDKNGNFSDSFLLNENAALGSWRLTANLINTKFSYTATFSVEEYKKPEFVVNVKLEKPQYKSGEKITATVDAKYLFGAAVENAEVVYQVLRRKVHAADNQLGAGKDQKAKINLVISSPSGTGNYNYSNNTGNEVVTTGKTSIGKSGRCQVSYNTPANSKYNYEYTIIVYVSDASRRSISASTSCLVAYNDLQLSAWLQKNYFKPGEEALVYTRAVDLNGKPVKAYVKSKFFYLKNKSKIKEQSARVKITDSNGYANYKFLPVKTGNYLVELEARKVTDEKRPAMTNKNFYEEIPEDLVLYNRTETALLKLNLPVLDTAEAFNMWYNSDRHTIKILTDKQLYKEGEMVTALVYVPFSADVLIMLNSSFLGDYNSYRFNGYKDISGRDSGMCREIKLTFKAGLAGEAEFYVAAIHNGYLYQQSQTFSIQSERKKLNVEVDFDQEKYKPGDKATAKVKVTDANGKPVANANISLGTADESIYALGSDKTPAITDIFIDEEKVKAVTFYDAMPANAVIASTLVSRETIMWRARQLGSDYSRRTFMGNNAYYQVAKVDAKSTSIEGYVIDYQTGITVPFAQIQIDGSTFYADVNGHYYISGFNPNVSHVDIVFSNGKRKLIIHHLRINNKKINLNAAIPNESDIDQYEHIADAATNTQHAFSPAYWTQGLELSGNIFISGNDAGLRVKVNNAEGNIPLAFATVRLYNEQGTLQYCSATANNGECVFRKIKRGKYFIAVAYMDFQYQRIEAISLAERNNMEINIAMSSSAKMKMLNNDLVTIQFDPANGQYKYNNSGTSQAFLKGRVLDENRVPLSVATIFLMQNGVRKAAKQSDYSGNFMLGPVNPGNYDLVIKYIGYPDMEIKGITLKHDMTVEMPIPVVMKIEDGHNRTQEVVIRHYADPQLNRDQTTQGKVMAMKEISSLATRSVNSVVASSSGVVSTDHGISGKGGRYNSNIYYVDGIKMGGAPGINPIRIPTDAQQFNEASIRENFKDLILWNNTLMTNDSGYAEIQIFMPDNLTGWQTTARVVTADAKAAQATANIKVSKELLVRMETPRFITLGDTLLVATNIHNYLNEDKAVKISLEANGLHIAGMEKIVMVKAGGEARVDWQVESKLINHAKLTVKALTDVESDAMVAEVPVQPYGLEVSEPLVVEHNSERSRKVNFEIGKEVDLRSAKLEVNVSPSMASALLSSMNSLISYPYGCVEQTMSRFIPLVLAIKTMETLGSDYTSTFTPEELNKMVTRGSTRLAELQNKDGSWGWWQNDRPNAFMTAYVCYGFNLARSAGYYVPDAAYQNGLDALRSQIIIGSQADAQSFAYKMMVAMQCGMKDLWKKHRYMPSSSDNNYTRAMWLQAAYYAGDTEMIKKLVNDLEKAAVYEDETVTWSQTPKGHYYNWQNDPVEATANVIKALLLTSPDNKLIVPAARWIMLQREGNAWHNTRQTAMCIFALNGLIKKELNAEYRLDVFANGRHIGEYKVNGTEAYKAGRTLTFTEQSLLASADAEIGGDPGAVLNYGSNTIEIRQKGEGQWFMSARVSYYLNLSDKQTAKIAELQKDNLFTISREYYKILPKKDFNGKVIYKKIMLEQKAIKPGDEILVKVKVNTAKKQDYVLVEDPIPAGCEFIRDTKGYIIAEEAAYNGMPKNGSDWYTHREMRDSKLALMVTTLQPGEYEYTYLLKAQIPGNYRITPAVAQLMYYPEKRGFSNFYKLIIRE